MQGKRRDFARRAVDEKASLVGREVDLRRLDVDRVDPKADLGEERNVDVLFAHRVVQLVEIGRVERLVDLARRRAGETGKEQKGFALHGRGGVCCACT